MSCSSRGRHAYRRQVTTTAGLQPERTTVVVPGSETSLDLNVHNNGDIVEGYQFEPVGPLAAWTQVSPDRLSLYPGTSDTVTLTIRPPRSPEVPSGEVPIGVRVLPAEYPDTGVVPETTVTVAPFLELSAILVPRLRKRRWRARHTVELEDRGNTPLAVTVTATEPGEQLRFSKPKRHVLESGEATAADVVVRSRKLKWFGKPAQYPFEVAIESEQGATEIPEPVDDVESRAPSRTLEGTFVHLPIFPSWLLALLGALLALLLAWFALLKPAIQSAADQAVNKMAQQTPQAQKNPSGGGATPSQNKPGGQSPANNPSSPPANPAQGTAPQTGAGSGTQFTHTLETVSSAGRGTSESYSPPPNSLFQVTDMIVSNFQGDQGLMTITADNETIATIALENFRNEDFHWVTPIAIPQGQAITINVTCSQPGVSPTNQQAKNCVEVLNVNGTMVNVPH
jgi:hypothetical protein